MILGPCPARVSDKIIQFTLLIQNEKEDIIQARFLVPTCWHLLSLWMREAHDHLEAAWPACTEPKRTYRIPLNEMTDIFVNCGGAESQTPFVL